MQQSLVVSKNLGHVVISYSLGCLMKSDGVRSEIHVTRIKFVGQCVIYITILLKYIQYCNIRNMYG
jgi:hypothetical protein